MRKFAAFIALSLLLPSAFAQETTSTYGDWKVLKIEDPFEDTTRAIASLVQGENALVVKCDEPGSNSIYFSVYFSGYIGDGSRPNREVTIRFDDDEPIKQNWHHDKSYAAQFDFPKADALIKRLTSASKFAIRAYSYDYDSNIAIFEWSDGTEEAMKAVYDTCVL
jgi:hypothetical protein